MRHATLIAALLLCATEAHALSVQTINPPIDAYRIYIASRVSDGTTWVAFCNQFDGPYDCQQWNQLGNAAGMFKDVYIINGTVGVNEIVVHNDTLTKNIDGVIMGKISGVNQWKAPSGGLAVLEIHGRGGHDTIEVGDVVQVKLWGDDGDDNILANYALQVKGGNGSDAFVNLGAGTYFYGEDGHDYFCNFGAGPGYPALFHGGSKTDQYYGQALSIVSVELGPGDEGSDAHQVCTAVFDDIVETVQD